MSKTSSLLREYTLCYNCNKLVCIVGIIFFIFISTSFIYLTVIAAIVHVLFFFLTHMDSVSIDFIITDKDVEPDSLRPRVRGRQAADFSL